MGATTFVQDERGTNVNEVFEMLVNDAKSMYGEDPYNGTISTTSLGREIHLPNEVLSAKDKDKAINEFLSKNSDFGFTNKWETRYANLGVVHYEAFTPKWEQDEIKPERKKGVRTESKFSVVPRSDRKTRPFTKAYQANNKFETLAEAKNFAKKRSLETGKEMTITKHRSNGEMFQLGHMKLVSDGKTYKKSKKLKTKTFKPVYDFLFFVYAAT